MVMVHPNTQPNTKNPIYWRDDKQYIRLYYFMPAEHFIDVLQNDEIKVSIPERCNDPLEFMPAGEHNMIQGWREAGGFISFSSRYDSSLMWAHYADAHRGVCLQFDFPVKQTGKMNHQINKEENNHFAVIDVDDAEQYSVINTVLPFHKPHAVVVEIRYAKSRPPYEVCGFSGGFINGEIQDVSLPRYLYTKSREWAYEKEWRLIVSPFNAKGFRNNDFFVRGLTKYLTGVTMGTKFSQTNALTWALMLQALKNNPTLGGEMIYPRLTRAAYDSKLYRIILKDNDGC